MRSAIPQLEVCEWTVLDWKLSFITIVEGVTTLRNRIEFGQMAEWLKAPVLKTGELKGFVGSNPTLSAKQEESK